MQTRYATISNSGVIGKGKGDASIQIPANFIKYIYNPETVPTLASAMDEKTYCKYLFGSGGAKKEKLGFGFYKMKASGEQGGTKLIKLQRACASWPALNNCHPKFALSKGMYLSLLPKLSSATCMVHWHSAC